MICQWAGKTLNLPKDLGWKVVKIKSRPVKDVPLWVLETSVCALCSVQSNHTHGFEGI